MGKVPIGSIGLIEMMQKQAAAKQTKSLLEQYADEQALKSVICGIFGWKP